MAERNEPRPARILIAEDDDNLRRLVAAYLERDGYAVTQAPDGLTALEIAQRTSPDLLILDIMLPGASGLEVAERVRPTQVPMLFLTALGEEADLLAGFAVGGDDYLVKPFNPKELLARVRAVLRRSGATGEEEQAHLSQGGISLDLRRREAVVDGVQVELTTREFDLLRALMEHPGWVFSRDQLLETVWGYQVVGETRVVDTHVANLRKKIERDPAEPEHVLTVRGVGYKFKSQ